MDKSEVIHQKRWNWIHRTLVIVGIVGFLPLFYLGAAPFVAKALMPIYDKSDHDGVFVKSVEVVFWPIQQICDKWPWYEKWGNKIVGAN